VKSFLQKNQSRIGIVAPSSRVPQAEFKLGLEKIRAAGFAPLVHPQCKDAHWFFAGTDETRANAFFEYACRDDLDVIWSARGGYGSIRMLPILERLALEKGIPPRKLLAGYSDSTALAEFVRTRWGWSTLHCSMPGLRQFVLLPEKDFRSSIDFIEKKIPREPWGRTKLKIIGRAPSCLEGEIVGGNLTVWTSMLGTPYAGNLRGKIAFFEDVDESLYRLDRMVQQLLFSGTCEGAKAIVLGNFLNCRDGVVNALKKVPHGKSMARIIANPKPSELASSRKKLNEEKLIPEIFAQLAEKNGIPIYYSLPVGHGPAKAPLPLGGHYRISASGQFELVSWNWLSPPSRE